MKPPVDSVMFNMRPNPGIMIVAGEASGDMHGAKLAEALARQDRRPDVFGIGGDRMRSAGVRIEVDAHRLSVVGITEVLAKLPQILDGMRTAKRLIREKKPDLLILIDFPDFNLHLASFAKRHAVPVLYYISPQIWAWRQGRVRKIRRIVDHMAVILPFEETFYRRHGVPVTFVGHPIMDHYVSSTEPSGPHRDDQTATVGLLPGSRDSEVRKLLPLMLSAAERIGRRRKVHFLLSQAPSQPWSDSALHARRALSGHPFQRRYRRAAAPGLPCHCGLRYEYLGGGHPWHADGHRLQGVAPELSAG